jgi:hypothetical protein
VRKELAAIAAYERRYGAGEMGGYTHATWRELQAVEIEPTALAESDWSLVFDLVRRLERDPRFSPERIRFVVWYNW